MSDKRVTIKYNCPNPLFEQWLTEWRDKAKENDSKMQYTFSNALKSLQKYPVPLNNAKECKILKGFGDKLCTMLDSELKKHRMITGELPLTQKSTNTPKKIKEPKVVKDKPPKDNPLNDSKSVDYVPKYGSGPYAILYTLYEKSTLHDYPGFLKKVDIIKGAQPMCDSSFTKSDPGNGSFYTAWSSMKTLITKKLVTKEGNPARFSLTEQGKILGRKLLNGNDRGKDASAQTVNKNKIERTETITKLAQETSDKYKTESLDTRTSKTSNDPCSSKDNSESSVKSLVEKYLSENFDDDLNDKPSSSSNFKKFRSETIEIPNAKPSANFKRYNSETDSTNSNFLQRFPSCSSIKSDAASTVINEETYLFAPKSFDIILYVDTQETSGGKTQPKDDPILQELSQLNVQYEIKHLKIGDYTWICRHRETKIELVLPYIVERKRLDDFGSSIKDGRFHEQKFRLKQCGLQFLIYLVEKHGKNDDGHYGLPLSNIQQAAANTLIQDGFAVKFSDNLRGTAEYLACMTTLIQKNYEDKTISSCSKVNLSKIHVEDDLIFLMVFNEFNKASSKQKSFKVKDMFIKQLLQIKGMSVDRAMAITEKYPTPLLLRSAYEDKSLNSEKLLSNIPFGKFRKNIGIPLSKTIFQLFTLDHLN